MWSLDLDGTVVGTPVYSRQYHVLYVVHNVPLTADMQTLNSLSVNETPQSTAGTVSVLQLPLFAANGGTNDGSATNIEVVATLPTVSTGRPFGPPSMVGTMLMGDNSNNPRQGNDMENNVDIVLVADATVNSPYGALFVIQGRGGSDYQFIIGSTGIGPSYTPPVLDPTNNYVYVTQAGASVVAWRNDDAVSLLSGLDANSDNTNDAFWGRPTWAWPVQTNDENPSARTYKQKDTLYAMCFVKQFSYTHTRLFVNLTLYHSSARESDAVGRCPAIVSRLARHSSIVLSPGHCCQSD
jgi:hypothetical protein